MKKIILISFFVVQCLLLSACDIDSIISEENEKNFSYEISKQYLDKYGVSYYIEGTVQNNTDNDYSYIQIEFICYDKQGNNLGNALDNSNNLLKNQAWKFKAIFIGSYIKNVDHCEYYKITAW